MTSLPVSTSRQGAEAHQRLRQHVARSSLRDAVLRTVGGVVLAGAGLVFLLFVLAAVDAFVPLPASVRWGGLMAALLLTLLGGAVMAWQPWRRGGRQLSAAEQIEHTAGAGDQPIVRGLSLMKADADPVTAALRERAERRAADLAGSVTPAQAYPLATLRRQGRWLWLACVGWLVLAIVFPNQLLGVFTRAAAPWIDAAPFNLTQLEPTWTPEPPDAGDDVTISVEPTGVQPETVELQRLDENGDVAETIEMTPDQQGGFQHTLRRVDEPITFRLQANGRATRSYTIEPTPAEPEPDGPTLAEDPDASNDPGGTTQYDPEAVARRDAAANWAPLREQIEALLADLADAEARAGAIDPADAQAIDDLADTIAELSDRAAALSDDLNALQGELPSAAAASLAQLQAALSQLQTGQLPSSPGSSPGDAGNWLSQAQSAARSDQARIAQGLGESDVPTESGTASGNPGDAPTFTDPGASGTYDGTGEVGDDGPLPAAVMQQVPPSYRRLITAYFNRLSQPQPDDAP